MSSSPSSESPVTVGVFDEKFMTAADPSPPYVDGNYYVLDGLLQRWLGDSAKVYSPIYKQGSETKQEIGVVPMMGENEALDAITAASHAYNNGTGEWPRMGPAKRIETMEKFVEGLNARRDEIVKLLMWEIAKPLPDSQKEVDRTIVYIKDTIAALKKMENQESTFTEQSGIIAHERQLAIGTVVVLGPFNYPFNETYTLLIPALLMGNTVVLKQPRTGCLCHTPSLSLFADLFPKGVVNTVSGAGRTTMPAIMKSGLVDVFSFIGTNSAAAAMIKDHPAPNRLRVCLGLDAKNAGIILPSADLEVAVNECILGSLSYNGQRCTALKILYVHKQIADKFVAKFAAAVDALKLGMPWHASVNITPLPEPHKPRELSNLIIDAVSKGAEIVNPKVGGIQDRTLVAPTVLYPVTKEMNIYTVEQFGPVVPIVPFSNVNDVLKDLSTSPFGQQASVFSSSDEESAPIIDALVHQVSRVNLNCQCQRGPDNLPFTGRRNSAAGALSVTDALRMFSIPSLVATKTGKNNQAIIQSMVKKGNSQFVRLEHLF